MSRQIQFKTNANSLATYLKLKLDIELILSSKSSESLVRSSYRRDLGLNLKTYIQQRSK